MYFLQLTNNRTRKERLSHASENRMAASHVVQIHMHARFPSPSIPLSLPPFLHRSVSLSPPLSSLFPSLLFL